MNYRHAFHAGNFADVHKHVVLLALLEHLHKKPAAYLVLDTHAGRGRYDLQSESSTRGGEWQHGVGRLRDLGSLPAQLKRYVELALHANTYAGSPLLIAATLRERDRAVFVEAQTDEAVALKETLGRQRRVAVLNQDGYTALKAHLPPKENRGLVFIDPPYEQDSEFTDAANAAVAAWTRWPNGMICVWYPSKAGGAERQLHKMLLEARVKKILLLELGVRPKDSPLGLNGSGLLIVNPPWQLDIEMRALLNELHRLLAPDGAGGVRIEWLAGE